MTLKRKSIYYSDYKGEEMRKTDIYIIATTFRSAIKEAQKNREFDNRDRMSNFPWGCCDDACDLLAYYLLDMYNIHTQQGNGVYRDDNPYNTTNHAWLVMDDGTIIDITGEQFETCAGYIEKVYVDKENSFYKNLEEKKLLNNYDITKNIRLWKDYRIIMKYLSGACLIRS